MMNKLNYVTLGIIAVVLLVQPIFIEGSVSSNFFSRLWTRALEQTFHEQAVEDENAVHKMDDHLVRRLIVMPLTDAFNPSQISPMHGKVQYGDKCSLPSSIGRAIFEKPYEVPWIFEMTPVTSSGTQTELSSLSGSPPNSVLKKAYISPLDFRAPENYIFLPQWLMLSLGLAPNDFVDVSFIRLKLASLVVLQPLSESWDKLMEHTQNPRTVLEHEVNKYSSLTAGATIVIEFNGIEFPLFVKETRAEGGISVRAVRVQDADVRVDIDRSIIDEILAAKNKTKSVH